MVLKGIFCFESSGGAGQKGCVLEMECRRQTSPGRRRRGLPTQLLPDKPLQETESVPANGIR
jgi:hypothetical protein